MDGSPDSCELLSAAAPQTLLGKELAPARRIYGLCWFLAKDSGDPEKSVGLEIRRESEAGVPTNQDEFWEREAGGVGLAGGAREQIEELDGPGDYSLWHPVDGGLRLFAYWDGEYVLVLTVKGAPLERALPWARELARAAVRQASAARTSRWPSRSSSAGSRSAASA
jgi:hypothetical protein